MESTAQLEQAVRRPRSPHQATSHHHDAWGLPLSAESEEAVRGYERAVLSLLAHRADVPAQLASALAADAALPLAHLVRGFGLRLLARGDVLAEAERALRAAEAGLAARAGGTPREALLADALGAFCAHDPARAIGLLARATEAYPSCLLSMKLHHALCFMHGKVAEMRASLERNLKRLDPSMRGYNFVLGCYAFALEESSAFEQAERVARQALALCSDDPWSYHALLHVMTMQDRTREGLAWIRARRGRFPSVNNFDGHIAWHHALFALAERELDEALALYDGEIVSQLGRDYRDLANCASLLFRLERAGTRVGDRWERLADWAEVRAGDHLLAFADLHQLLALLGAGRIQAARAYLTALRTSLVQRRDGSALITRRAGLPMAEGLLALYVGDPGQALFHLWPLACRAGQLGGSRAQRELFDMFTFEAAIAAGKYGIAHQLASAQLAERPDCSWVAAYADHGRARSRDETSASAHA